jgi:hypothetical protein
LPPLSLVKKLARTAVVLLVKRHRRRCPWPSCSNAGQQVATMSPVVVAATQRATWPAEQIPSCFIHLLIKSPQFFYLVLNKGGCFNFMSYESAVFFSVITTVTCLLMLELLIISLPALLDIIISSLFGPCSSLIWLVHIWGKIGYLTSTKHKWICHLHNLCVSTALRAASTLHRWVHKCGGASNAWKVDDTHIVSELATMVTSSVLPY